jgi:hypothetical protein
MTEDQAAELLLKLGAICAALGAIEDAILLNVAPPGKGKEQARRPSSKPPRGGR